MSREFGNYSDCGYMHDKVESAARDCSHGDYDITELLGDVLSGLAEIAYGVSSVEECDWSEGQAISHALRAMPRVERAVAKLGDYLSPFATVADEAVCRAAEERSTCAHERRQKRYGAGRVVDTCLQCGDRVVEEIER